tara:strand:+ start:492 stop:659 length:168 start_codon:yes stop_codon:yes gene_type:complete
MLEHIDHIFYCESKERAEEIKHAIENSEAEPEDFSAEYMPEAGEASFDINSTNIT